MDRIAEIAARIKLPKFANQAMASAEKERVQYTRRRKAYVDRRTAEDPGFAAMLRLRKRMSTALKASGARRARVSEEAIGCTMPQLREHLENQFLPRMSWENRDQWHIDHITPCAAFDLLDPEQQAACFHYTNLRPIWARDNLRKSSKVVTCQPELPIPLPRDISIIRKRTRRAK